MIAASLILDFTGIECTYGNIPNIPQDPDPRIEEIVFDKESDCQLLEDWLEKQLAGKLPHRLSEIYTDILRLVQKASNSRRRLPNGKKHTGPL